MMLKFKNSLLVVLSLLMAFAPAQVRAQTPAPWQFADAARKAMFEAQTELLGGNAAGAQAKLDVAKQELARYTELLQPFAPEVADEIGRGAALLRPYDNGDNAAEFAAARASAWALMLKGGYAATLKAIEQNQPEAAQQWLQIRAFRKSTKLSSARADATQALADWRAGKLSQSDAIAATGLPPNVAACVPGFKS